MTATDPTLIGSNDDKPVLVNDFLNRSFQNRLAKEVTYTKPVILGVAASFGAHSFLGPILMGINPLLGLASLLPILVGIRAAKASADGFFDTYEESIENPGLWTEFVNPDALAGTEKLLLKPVDEVIKEGLATRLKPGKPSPLHQQIIKLMKGANQVNPTCQTSCQTGSTRSSTENYSDTTSEATPSSCGVKPTTAGRSSLPRAVAQLDEAAPHLFMVGRTREGKSETLKYLIGNEKRVWYLTSKATDKVPEHWQGYRVGGPDIGLQVTWLLDQWEATFLRHLEGEDTEREWFVIDEAVGIIQSLKTKGFKRPAERLRGFIVECLTAGAAVSAFGGILSQTGNAGPLGVDEDLLKNFSIVGCGKRKKSQMLAAFLKLTDLKVTADQQEEILALDGYWQLWENNGPCLSQVPLSKLPLKDVVRCPAPEPDDEADTVAIPKVYVEVPTQKQPRNDLRQRILDHLQGHGEARTAREIRNACTRPTDEPRATTEEIKAELEELIRDDKICKWIDSAADRYQVTGTP